MRQPGIYRSAAGERAVRERYEQLLDAWPVPSERLRVPTREGETFVLASGPRDAPPVIALQGSAANAAMWLPQITTWAGHLRVYAVDVIGEPGLSAASRPPMRGDTYARWLDDVRRGLGLERAAMVGVSLGGWLALDYAIRYPDAVTRLAVLCPSGLGRQRYGALAAAALLLPFGEWGARRTVVLMLGPEARPRPAEHRPDADGADPAEPGAALGAFAMLVFAHFRPRMVRLPRFGDGDLARLTMPVLAVVGARDALVDSAGTARRLAAAVPHARVSLLPGAGHLLPDQTRPLLDFLTEPAPAPTG